MKNYAAVSALQFETIERLARNLTCDSEDKQILLQRIQTVMEYHQDIITELETRE